MASFARAPTKLPAALSYGFEVIPLTSRLVARAAQPFVMGRWSTTFFTNKFRHALASVPASTLAHRLREVLKVDVTKDLKCLTLPMLYLAARRDRLISERLSKDFALANCRLISVEGPHFLLQAKPQETAAIVRNFLAQLK